MRLVITGAGGQVGTFLAAAAGGQGRDVVTFTSSRWNITDAGAGARIVQPGDVVINCAAYTDVDAAETDEPAAHAVNATGPHHLAVACAQAGAQLIHISTDYVFSGDFGGSPPHPYTPADATGPLSVYGRTKLAGERAVLAALPTAAVVRTAWVYTGQPAGNDFVAAMRRLADGAGTVEMVDDQIGSPTYAGDLVAALLSVADSGGGGVLHAANGGQASRFDQARAVFAGVGADPQWVRPVNSGQHPRPARRPAYSALAAAGVAPLRGWRDALAAALAAGPLSSTP